MLKSRSPLKIDDIAPRFASLLREEGTSIGQPALDATWRAFATFCREPLHCDDERLLFEADLSTSQPVIFMSISHAPATGENPGATSGRMK
jgi:hypothetical protein